ncbi:hypothetical protein IL306_002743 [Fusarium sp. DS 682]|nr:hypothetical protein IL306_002743 [Fusarium sp. DS 682]
MKILAGVAAEVTRVQKFLAGIDAYKRGTTAQPPKRPMLVFLSGIFDREPRNPMAEWLILDEAHSIKNRESRTYHSVSTLREQFDGCLMMTGTPLDNKWQDDYALLRMLKGHPISNFLLFKAAFLQSLSSGPGYPEGYHKARYIQMLDATSLRRPQNAIEQAFPRLHRTMIVKFSLDPEDRRRSNEAFKMFKKSRRPGGRGGKTAGWKHLVTAQ